MAVNPVKEGKIEADLDVQSLGFEPALGGGLDDDEGMVVGGESMKGNKLLVEPPPIDSEPREQDVGESGASLGGLRVPAGTFQTCSVSAEPD